MMAPTKFTPAAITKTGIQRPCDCVTNSAVSGPHVMPGIVACKVQQISFCNYNRVPQASEFDSVITSNRTLQGSEFHSVITYNGTLHGSEFHSVIIYNGTLHGSEFHSVIT